MQVSLWIVLVISLIGDLLVFLASAVMLAHKKTIAILTKYATPFAAGALLAAAFLDFLREGVEQYDSLTVLTAALVGILFFFVLEGWLHWFHHHSKEPFEPKSGKERHHHETDPIVALAAGGNWLHNFIDGGAIAAAFLVSMSAGIITTFAVALHEIPREVADSGYLLKRGMKRRGVLVIHGIAILATAVGTTLFYLLGRHSSELLALLIGSTAGFFTYIAASDIIPSINQSRNEKKAIDWQVVLVILGAVIVGAAVVIAHHFIPE